MKKVFAYIRKSIDRASEKSIERQKDSIRAYAKENNLEIIEEYAEVASSATLHRSELQRMLLDVSKNPDIDYILVDSFDRVSREMDHFGWILSQLKDILNVKTRLHSCTEENDYEDDHYRLFLIMMKTFGATEERVRIVNRLQSARRNKQEKGGFIGGMPPFGYKSINGSGELFINENEVSVVKMVFDLRDQKHTMQQIANALNKTGHKTRKGASFKAMTIQRIIKHRDLYEGKKQTPAILTKENKKSDFLLIDRKII